MDQTHPRREKTPLTPHNALVPAIETIVVGDCLDIASTFLTPCFDLIYIDPPYFTKRDFISRSRLERADSADRTNSILDTASFFRFSDRWHPHSSTSTSADPLGRGVYLDWLGQRIQALRRLLTPHGVFLLHLDWHVVHYAKVLCDALFGDAAFCNELIWYYQTGGASKDHFSRKHDTILVYARGPDYYFDGKSIAIPRTAKAMKRAQCATGARIKATDTHKNPDDVLVVPALNPMSNERTGYPTQKPIELLAKLITALCPPSGLVGDFCCGSGTTLVAAKRLGRRYFGCDLSPAAVAIAQRRLAEQP